MTTKRFHGNPRRTALDNAFESHRRAARRNTNFMIAWFAFCATIAVGLLAVGVWGFIELVRWVISK